MQIRSYRREDTPKILNLFKDTVHQVNAKDYTTEQLKAWAPQELSPQDYESRFLKSDTWVAELEGQLVGFINLTRDGCVDMLFVHAQMQGKGIAGRLMSVLVQRALELQIPQLHSDVSLTARAFFERQGFVMIQEQSVFIRGVRLSNFRMIKQLSLFTENSDRTALAGKDK